MLRARRERIHCGTFPFRGANKTSEQTKYLDKKAVWVKK
jgi:hypothetical protein